MAQDNSSLTPGPMPLSTEQAQAVGGGDCNIKDYITAVDNFKAAYDSLIDFTSYVIERVIGP